MSGWLSWSDLVRLSRTTTARVAALQAIIASVFVCVVVALVYNETVGAFERETRASLEREFAQVAALYRDAGLRSVSQDMIVRISAPGSLLYVLTDSKGEVIAGDFAALPSKDVTDRLEPIEFKIEVEQKPGQFAKVRASGVLGRLDSGGPILLVARDMSSQDAAAARIVRMLLFGLGLGLLLALAAGLAAGRQAARRAEDLSRTTRDVMAGDLGRRAKVRGGTDEFNRLAMDLNAMLDRMQKLVLQMRSAGDAIAHDLRSPLTRMRGQLEAALANPPNADSDREALARTMQECDRLLKTFNAVLQITRLESRSGWDFEVLDAGAVVAEFFEFYEPVAEDAGLAMQFIAADGLMVKGDARLLGQAVSNLIENAIKYTPAGGVILVEPRRRSDGRVEILVEDDGPGIPATERARVVDRFVRLEEHRMSPGVGLGLSLVSAVAGVHGGRLELRDGRRTGTQVGGGPGLGVAMILPGAAASEGVR